ncbi:MAG TPA: helix-turn-helix domain-containing protein [Dehalococcoidia bacterium]|nr:helix-turn-helix domain-containing protein [Dehalococcoidia bacterium]
MIGVSRSRLYEYLASGAIESFRADRGIRLIPVEALRAWVEQQRVAARGT